MKTISLEAYVAAVAGRDGCLLRELGNLPRVLRHGLLRSGYAARNPEAKTVRNRLYAGHLETRYLRKIYARPEGKQLMREDILFALSSCGSIHRVRLIQSRVHQWLFQCDLSEDLRRELERRYVPENASRDQVAEYLLVIQHYLLTR